MTLACIQATIQSNQPPKSFFNSPFRCRNGRAVTCFLIPQEPNFSRAFRRCSCTRLKVARVWGSPSLGTHRVRRIRLHTHPCKYGASCVQCSTRYFTFDMQRRQDVCSSLVLMYLPPHSHSSTTTSSTLSIHLPSLKKFFDILFTCSEYRRTSR